MSSYAESSKRSVTIFSSAPQSLYVVFGFRQHICHLSAETFTTANETRYTDMEEIQLVLKAIIGFPGDCIRLKM
jgi:hypothetical protein